MGLDVVVEDLVTLPREVNCARVGFMVDDEDGIFVLSVRLRNRFVLGFCVESGTMTSCRELNRPRPRGAVDVDGVVDSYLAARTRLVRVV